MQDLFFEHSSKVARWIGKRSNSSMIYMFIRRLGSVQYS